MLVLTVLCSLLAVHAHVGGGGVGFLKLLKFSHVQSEDKRGRARAHSSCQAANLVASSIASELWSEGLCVVYPVRTFPSMISLES